jgi:hypothetical protein
MTRTQAVEAEELLEQGSISFLCRPRVEERHPTDLGDVQRLLLLLSPADSAFQRLIAVGRKRLPSSAQHDRFWGFIDLVLTPYDMEAALDAQMYGTKTRGLRHLPAARVFAEGTYEMTTHNSHGHFAWHIDRFTPGDPISLEVDVERDADYILTIANPDPIAWGLLETPDLQTQLFDELELHVPLPTPFPPSLQERFGNRRFAQLDTTAWLDHPGAELVFVGAG